MAKIVSSAILRENFSDVVRAVSNKENYFLVTKRGKPTIAIVNLDYFEDLLALSSKEYLKAIKEARKDIENNRIYSHNNNVFGTI